DARPDETGKRPIREELRRALIEKPPVNHVLPSQTEFHAEGRPCFQGVIIRVENVCIIVRMYAFGPTRSQLLLLAPPGKAEPRLVYVGERTGGIRHPQQYGCLFGHRPNT